MDRMVLSLTEIPISTVQVRLNQRSSLGMIMLLLRVVLWMGLETTKRVALRETTMMEMTLLWMQGEIETMEEAKVAVGVAVVAEMVAEEVVAALTSLLLNPAHLRHFPLLSLRLLNPLKNLATLLYSGRRRVLWRLGLCYFGRVLGWASLFCF